ncbi:MAG: N-methyl-D-aspartate receptor NMDAR2C subunit [Candidatus Aenigmarchaeota archaeon]|nr:N-methyl-D-aspartate receptor NMDAR2C subunit [Candidatus Aenigmarchaeota archaeon]
MPELGRWLEFWKRIGAKGDPQKAYYMLEGLYSVQQRAYHNLSHIGRCLDEYHPARHLPEHPDEVEMALWFHDAFYDTMAADNETRSAQLAYRISRDIGLPDLFAGNVHDLILETRHIVTPFDIDSQVLADVDLSILGTPEVEFDEYENNIRKEYRWVPDWQFRAGRAKILGDFLARPSIYSTEFFREKYEGQARRNIERSLARLG